MVRPTHAHTPTFLDSLGRGRLRWACGRPWKLGGRVPGYKSRTPARMRPKWGILVATWRELTFLVFVIEYIVSGFTIQVLKTIQIATHLRVKGGKQYYTYLLILRILQILLPELLTDHASCQLYVVMVNQCIYEFCKNYNLRFVISIS